VHRLVRVVIEGRILLRLANLHAAEPADEIGVPILAPEFAVGYDRQSDALLGDDHVANRRVLDRAQFRRIDLTTCERFARRQNFRRAEQAADVIGVKERLRAGGGRRHRAHLPPASRTCLPCAQGCGVRELSVSVPVQAPSGFSLAFLNTYVSDLAGGGETEGLMPLRYAVTQLAGLTLERDVNVRVDYVLKANEPAVLKIAWEPDASLFPSFEGVLHAESTGERTCNLTIVGTYDVPGGVAGQLFDAVIGVNIARGTIDQLLCRFRDAIEADYKVRMEYS
jgi:hypothetical protein